MGEVPLYISEGFHCKMCKVTPAIPTYAWDVSTEGQVLRSQAWPRVEPGQATNWNLHLAAFLR